MKEIKDGLLDMDFIMEMVEVFARGIKGGRTANDWKDRNMEGFHDRKAAIGRHIMKYDNTKERRHFVNIACNAMICWVLHKRLKG